MGVHIAGRRQRQKGDNLHQHRADQVIEQILAPFVTEQPLMGIVRQDTLDRREHQPGGDHIHRKKVDAKEYPPAVNLMRLHIGAAKDRGRQRHQQRRHANRLVLAQQQAEQCQTIGAEQNKVSCQPKTGPIADNLQLRHGEPGWPAQRHHKGKARHAKNEGEKA